MFHNIFYTGKAIILKTVLLNKRQWHVFYSPTKLPKCVTALNFERLRDYKFVL